MLYAYPFRFSRVDTLPTDRQNFFIDSVLSCNEMIRTLKHTITLLKTISVFIADRDQSLTSDLTEFGLGPLLALLF